MKQLGAFWVALAACTAQRTLLLSAAGIAHALGVASKRVPWFTTGLWWLDCWAYWDSGWLLGVAQFGYPKNPAPGSALDAYAFFPAYPLAVRLLLNLLCWPLTLPYLIVSGFVVSFTCAVLATYVLYKIASEQHGEYAGLFTIFAFCALPGSFYMATVYSESLFILCILLSFYYGERNKWGRAAATCALATATRPLGIIVALVLFMQYVGWVRQQSSVWKRARAGLWMAFSPMGLILYSLYCWHRSGQLFAWSIAQRSWKRFLDWPWAGLVESYRIIGDSARHTLVGPRLPLFLDTVTLILFIFLAAKLSRLNNNSYLLFVWANLLVLFFVPVHGEWPWEGAKRYVVPLFPCFMLLGLWMDLHRKLAWVLLVGSLFVQCYFFALFGLGRWVI